MNATAERDSPVDLTSFINCGWERKMSELQEEAHAMHQREGNEVKF